MLHQVLPIYQKKKYFLLAKDELVIVLCSAGCALLKEMQPDPDPDHERSVKINKYNKVLIPKHSYGTRKME